VREADLELHSLADADLGSGDPIVFIHAWRSDGPPVLASQLRLADHFRLIMPS